MEYWDLKTIMACGFYIVSIVIGVTYLYGKRKNHTKEMSKESKNPS